MLAYWLIALSGPLFAIMPYLACMHGLHISAGFNSLLTHFCGMIIHITAQHTCRELMSCVRDDGLSEFWKTVYHGMSEFWKNSEYCRGCLRGIEWVWKKMVSDNGKAHGKLGYDSFNSVLKNRGLSEFWKIPPQLCLVSPRWLVHNSKRAGYLIQKKGLSRPLSDWNIRSN